MLILDKVSYMLIKMYVLHNALVTSVLTVYSTFRACAQKTYFYSCRVRTWLV